MSRFTLRVLTLVAFAVGANAEPADVDARFAEMQARIEQLEAKLAAQGDELAAAKAAPAAPAATPDVAADGQSFFDTINASGFVAASYFYNFNDPDGGSLGGSNAPVDLLHPDSNSFSLDQLWLTLSRDVSEEQRAGFRADFAYGKTASILSGDNNDGAAGNDFDLYQGYVTYLAPIGEGVTIQAGKFATLIGAEVAQANANWNITRGNVYNFLQPINHTGLLASTPVGPVTATLGVVDETRAFPALSTDRNNNKAILFGLGGGGE
ncbi:MAG TPA: outer membrane beta-barrel protein, partial [Myxococcota bacterium]|nr:outer membrane beta-barrel protein [Myxococcota bacterium]